MKRKALILLFAIFTITTASGQSNPQKEESVQDLKNKIQALEAKVLLMQARISQLEARRCDRTPAFPIPEGKMPPGARPFQFNGMKFWQLPVSPDSRQDIQKAK